MPPCRPDVAAPLLTVADGVLLTAGLAESGLLTASSSSPGPLLPDMYRVLCLAVRGVLLPPLPLSPFSKGVLLMVLMVCAVLLSAECRLHGAGAARS